MTCESCATELDGILYCSSTSVEFDVFQGGDKNNLHFRYLVNTMQVVQGGDKDNLITATFDFSSATSPGWSTGGGDPPYAFIRNEGSTRSNYTGPSAGVDGSGFYYYAEAPHPRVQGDLFTLAYDGSACSDTGVSVGTVTFRYHMYGSGMGELRVINTAGEAVWSLRGDQGKAWNAVSVDVYSPSFTFEYTRGGGWAGDAAVAQVAVTCAGAVLNCGHPCTRRQTIDLEGMGLAAGDAYTVWLRETNAARVVEKGPESPPHGLCFPKAERFLFQPTGARAFVGEQRAHHHHGQHAPDGTLRPDAVHAAWPRQPNHASQLVPAAGCQCELVLDQPRAPRRAWNRAPDQSLPVATA